MSESAPYLDPLNQALADVLAKQPPLQDLSPEQLRAATDKLQEHAPIAGVTRTSFTVPFEDGVKVFVFKPKGTTGTLPVIFYFHGGAWIAGNVNTHDSICCDLALKTGFAVVFPEYALAPEAHFPTQHEQCYAAVKWVSRHGLSKGLSQHAFAIAGDSAGGQLAVATTILCSTRKPLIPITYQVLLHPVTDLVTDDRPTRSEFLFFNGPFLTVPFLSGAVKNYIPVPKDRVSELATPQNISADHAKKQPPTLIVTSSADPLRDGSLVYGKILQQAGIDVAIMETKGQLHDSEVTELTRQGATPRASVRLVAASIKEAIEGLETRTKRKADDLVEPGEETKTTTTRRRKARKSY